MGADLLIDGVSVARGELIVVRDVHLPCPAGQVTVLLGANGAGKTSLLDSVAGVIPVTRGTIALGGKAIQRLARDRRAGLGLSYVEQGRSIFGALTVEENLAVVAGRSTKIERAYDLFPELKPRRKIAAQMLSGGEQQMLVLGRAIVGEPQVLLIDEMSQGLAPVLVKRLMPFVETAAKSGIAVLLVEQFAHMALQIGDQAYVLSVGSIVLEGNAKDLLNRPDDVRHAYFAGQKDGHGGGTAAANGAPAPRPAQKGDTRE
jgi:branched-chain amino acid transport system ATP-binding protein